MFGLGEICNSLHGHAPSCSLFKELAAYLCNLSEKAKMESFIIVLIAFDHIVNIAKQQGIDKTSLSYNISA